MYFKVDKKKYCFCNETFYFYTHKWIIKRLEKYSKFKFKSLKY